MNRHTLDSLGIQLPIIQAPMAGTSTPELAAAVSNAGGMGSMGLAAHTVDQAREAIRRCKGLTSAPFNANFFCHRAPVSDGAVAAAWLEYLSPLFNESGIAPPATLEAPYASFNDNPAMLDMLLEERPPIVSFHFGIPSAADIRKLKATGIILMATATTLPEAQAIEAAGLDVIVAQGVEAGGHRGVFDPHDNDLGLTTLALTRLLSTHVSRPVIAAGGIMDGQGIHAVLQLGACAAMMGTAFILCPESAASDAYRQVLGSDKASRTRITAVASGRPARGIVNSLHTRIDTRDRPATPDFPICYSAAKALQKAAQAQGNEEFSSHWAGQGAPLARAMPAADLVQTLVDELGMIPKPATD